MSTLNAKTKLRIKSVKLATKLNATSHLYTKEEDVMGLAETIYKYIHRMQ